VRASFRSSGNALGAGVSDDGSLVTVGYSDGRLSVFKADTGDVVGGYQNTLITAVGSGSGGMIAVGDSNGHIRRLTLPSGVMPANPQLVSDTLAHRDTINHIAFSADGRRFVSVSEDGAAKVWDAATGDLVFQVVADSSLLSAALTSDGGRLATAGKDGYARVFDIATRKELFSAVAATNGWVDGVAL
jgi:WD40 repeat protein